MSLSDRKIGDKLSHEDIESLVGRMITDARDFVQDELEADRNKATDYYFSRPFGSEEEGRSQVVASEVRDAVQAILPSLLRIFAGPEHVVEFSPREGEKDAPEARQRTDYVNYVFWTDNPGFLNLHSSIKDALVRRSGVLKWWWDEAVEEEEATYSGLSQQDLDVLLADEEVDFEIEGEPEPGVGDSGPLFRAKVFRTRKDGVLRVMSVPTEEISWNQSARSIDDAIIVVHSRRMRIDELVSLGFDFEELVTFAGTEVHDDTNAEATRKKSQLAEEHDTERDPMTREVFFHEAYVRLDLDGDGTTRLYTVPFVGESAPKMIGEPEGITHIPIAIGTPDPEPHTMLGLSTADSVMDLQLIKSEVLRGALDSLSLSLDPDTAVVNGEVSLSDLLNTDRGRIIRMSSPDMMREIPHRFVGPDAIGMLDYMDKIKEDRTGQNRASQGLDADTLQSSTKAAVAATLSGAQQHLELLARILAETLLVPTFRGMAKTLIEHQPRQRSVRLRGSYEQVDPRSWNATMDVKVNVALGAGLPEDQLMALKEIAAKQEAILQEFGPMNPLVSLSMYRNTLALIAELSGRKNPDRFWKEISPMQEEQFAAMLAQQKQEQPTDPNAAALAQAEMARVQVELQRVQGDLRLKEQELATKRHEIELRDDRERDKTTGELALALEKLRVESDVSITREELTQQIAIIRAAMEGNTRRDVAAIQAMATERDDDGQ